MKVRAAKLQPTQQTQVAQVEVLTERQAKLYQWWAKSVPVGYDLGFKGVVYLSSPQDKHGHLAPWKGDTSGPRSVTGTDCDGVFAYASWERESRVAVFRRTVGAPYRAEYIARKRLLTADELVGLCPSVLIGSFGQARTIFYSLCLHARKGTRQWQRLTLKRLTATPMAATGAKVEASLMMLLSAMRNSVT